MEVLLADKKNNWSKLQHGSIGAGAGSSSSGSSKTFPRMLTNGYQTITSFSSPTPSSSSSEPFQKRDTASARSWLPPAASVRSAGRATASFTAGGAVVDAMVDSSFLMEAAADGNALLRPPC